MTSKKSNTEILMRELVKQEFEIYKESFKEENDFFEFFISKLYLKKYDFSDDEITTGITGAGGDGGCDSVYIVIDQDLVYEDTDIEKYKEGCNLKLYIFQAKQRNSFNESPFKAWKEIVDNLLDIENVDSIHTNYGKRYNKLLIDKIELFLLSLKKLIRKKPKLSIEFIYASLGNKEEIHKNVCDQSDDLKSKIKEKFPSVDTGKSVTFLDVNMLKAIYDEPDNNEFLLKFHTAPSVDSSSSEYVGLVNLSEYYNFITNDNKIQRNIFEANVRDFQGGTIVNKQIRETLEQPSSEDFWWLNNGVTILSEKAILCTAKDIRLTKPEIVNGLQTSYTVFNYYSESHEKLKDENRKLLVRIIVPPNDSSRDKIILATNSQTNIPKSSLRATDSIHREIEQYFKNRGLYYDRRKNFYKNMGKNPNQIIGVSFLAQCLISILLGKPDYARARPSSCLNNDEDYRALYVDNQDLEVFYKAALVGMKIQKSLKRLSSYSSVVQNDLLFFIIYLFVLTQTNKASITPEMLKKVDIENISDSEVINLANKVYDIYKTHGETLKSGNGEKILTELKNNNEQ